MNNFDLNNCVYITSNPRRTVFYVGVTNSQERRISEHHCNKGKLETFAGKYFCYELIYFEVFQNIMKLLKEKKN